MSRGPFGRLLRVFARPVRRARGPRAIQTYRGYGTRDAVHLVGRVLRQPGAPSVSPTGGLLRDLRGLVRRFLRWGIGGTTVEVRSGQAIERVVTDRSGWFEATLRPETGEDPDALWHPVQVRLEDHPEVEAEASVLVPPRQARRVVISDIDDTVVHTGVANALEMLRNLFLRGAESRVAFPGVAELYRGLHRGASGRELNPMLYVSRGPWSLYEVLDEFFRIHEIPVGPVLFLRDWGLTLQHPLPRRSVRHKRELIERMLEIYSDLPFVLIGDSGQEDPEIYAEIVQEHPGRIEAVYIRDVDATDTARRDAIAQLARAVEEAGSSLVLAADSLAMAEHAAGLGLLSERTPERIRSHEAADPAAIAGDEGVAELDQPEEGAALEGRHQASVAEALEDVE